MIDCLNVLLIYFLYLVPLVLLINLIYSQIKKGGACISEKRRMEIVNQDEEKVSENERKIKEFYKDKKKVKLLNDILFYIFLIFLSISSVLAIIRIVEITELLLKLR